MKVAGRSGDVVEFSVAYNFGEYRKFVLDHLECLSGTAQLKGVKATPLVRLLVNVGSAVSFAIKKRRMPVCDFRIDGDEIRRTTADGVLLTKWTDVVAIRRYSMGYLIEKEKGAMPIPYRCLDESQRAALEALLRARESELAAPGNARSSASRPGRAATIVRSSGAPDSTR